MPPVSTPFAAIGVSIGLLLAGSAAAQPAPPGYQPGYPPGAPTGYPPGPPPGYPPPPAGYPPPPPGAVYAAPGYPAPPPGAPYIGPDGLTYVNGGPVFYEGGTYFPLVFVGGLGWGYYGLGHRWFGAPFGVRARLDHFYPGGRGFPYRGGPGFRGPGPYHGDRFDHDFRR